MTQPEGIEVEGLVREFRKGPRAVDGIDLEVAPGEIYGFLGPNGAGKSTTVLVLTTLLPPTSGTARVAGYDVVRQGPDVRARIGAALQEAALDPFLTGADHMRLQTAMHGLPKADRIARSRELLARVGLTEAADRKVGGYSGGMKRRLDLALALVHRPKILFLDEPTTGLDVQSRTALCTSRRPTSSPTASGSSTTDAWSRRGRRRTSRLRSDSPPSRRSRATRAISTAWRSCSSASASAPARRRGERPCGSGAASRTSPRS